MTFNTNVKLLLLGVTWCFMTHDSCGKLFPQKQRDFFIKIHNTLRRVPDATNMNEVSWDNDLAKKASKFANICNELFEFNNYDPKINMENIGITRYKLRSEKPNLLVPLLSWYSRGYFYNFEQNLCNITKTCQYYTHVMRSSTGKVGCGYGICPRGQEPVGLESGKHAFVVCFYGNSKYEDGQKLYKDGKYCKGCNGFTQSCRKQLCFPKSGLTG